MWEIQENGEATLIFFSFKVQLSFKIYVFKDHEWSYTWKFVDLSHHFLYPLPISLCFVWTLDFWTWHIYGMLFFWNMPSLPCHQTLRELNEGLLVYWFIMDIHRSSLYPFICPVRFSLTIFSLARYWVCSEQYL